MITAFAHNFKRLSVKRPAFFYLLVVLELAGLSAAPEPLSAQAAGVEQPAPGQSDPWSDALITDRPDFTESPTSVEPGRVQLEGGYTFSRLEDERSHTVGELLARIGAVDRLEFRLGINSFVFRSEPEAGDPAAGQPRWVRGLEDITLGLKVELIRPPPSKPGVPQIALLAGTTLPTGRSELGADGLTPGAVLAAGWDITGWLSGALNLGYANIEDFSGVGSPEEPQGRYDELTGSVALGFGLTKKLGAFAEWFAIYPLPSERDSENNADAGVTYMLSPGFQLDFRVGVGFGDPRPNFFVGTGAAWRI